MVPCNTLLHTHLPTLAALFVRSIQHEAFFPDNDSRTMIALIAEQMVLTISRSSRIAGITEKQTRTEKLNRNAMIKFRNQLCEHPEQKLSIRATAEKMNISSGRFTAIYRMFFRPPLCRHAGHAYGKSTGSPDRNLLSDQGDRRTVRLGRCAFFHADFPGKKRGYPQ